MESNSDFIAWVSLHLHWAGEASGLFLAPFVHENIAIVSAAALVVAHRLPVWLALVSLYAGMTVSDLALYGAGALARHNDRARILFMGRGSFKLGSFMRAHMGLAVIGARFIPGMIFPSYVACGWIGLPFRRFAFFCLTSAAIYLPIALTLAVGFGHIANKLFGAWAWIGLIIPIAAAGVIGSRLLSKRWMEPVEQHPDRKAAAIPEEGGSSEGHPPRELFLPETRRPYSLFEFWPAFIFYSPLFFYFVWQAVRYRSMSVPALANPGMENGGLWGESKVNLFEVMAPAGRRSLAPYTSIVRGDPGEVDHDLTRIADLAREAGITFPFVAKPDIGCKGNGVRVIRDTKELRIYLEEFPSQARILVQRLAAEGGEAGIFYARHPNEDMGSVISLTLKFAPHVQGNGTSTLEQLIHADRRAARIADVYLSRLGHRSKMIPAKGENVRLVFVGNHCKGAIFRNGAKFITPELTRRVDEIAKSIPDFYFGRFDVRFSSLACLQAGEALTLIEYNGGGSEATHIWDADTTLWTAYRDLFRQVRMIFAIGAANRLRGYKSDKWHRIIGAWWRQSRLMRRYPHNH